MNPTTTVIGTWSGGRFMHFGEPLDDARLEALLRPGAGIDTVMSADAYGAGEADRLLGKALKGIDRESYCLIGAIGHDFYEGEREGAKASPASPTRGCAQSATTGTTSGWRASAACSALAPSASTCCCCTTQIGPATPAMQCGRGWRRSARRG